MTIQVRPLCSVDYLSCLQAMREFTARRDAATVDEIWLVEHTPVFTQGLASKAEHLLDPGDIPVHNTERGGQVTYHGPGQVVAYLLLDIRRRGITIKDLVRRMEQALIDCISEYGVSGERRAGAPGVYVGPGHKQAGSKIAALGLKVSRGRTFHGLALNVDMDLTPFSLINPCGFPGLAVTDLNTVAGPLTPDQVSVQLAQHLISAIQA